MIYKNADLSGGILYEISRNNPYHRENTAAGYEKLLEAPFTRKIRRDEAKALTLLFKENLCKEDTVLEIGAGTGYYSITIASMVKHLTALEPALGMARQLREKAAEHNVSNIDLYEEYFELFTPGDGFDHVIALGVLDYLANPHVFIERCVSLSRKKFIFTVPNKGFWTLFYKLGALVHKTKIYRYSKKDLEQMFPNSMLQIDDAGLKTSITGGFSLICIASRSDNF